MHPDGGKFQHHQSTWLQLGIACAHPYSSNLTTQKAAAYPKVDHSPPQALNPEQKDLQCQDPARDIASLGHGSKANATLNPLRNAAKPQKHTSPQTTSPIS